MRVQSIPDIMEMDAEKRIGGHRLDVEAVPAAHCYQGLLVQWLAVDQGAVDIPGHGRDGVHQAASPANRRG